MTNKRTTAADGAEPAANSSLDDDSPAHVTSTAAGAAANGRGGAPRGSAETRNRQPMAGLKLDRRSRWIFYLLRAIVYTASLIPDFILYPLGVAGGFIGYVLDRRHVRIGLVNLAIAFPDRSDSERRRILRASYINLGRSAAEYLRMGGVFYRRLVSRVTYDRLDYWDEIERKYPGRGIVVLSAHFGNFELLPWAHALHGYQISLVHHTQRFIAGDALVTWIRERADVDILRKHSAARAVLKALGAGQLVGIPFDQNAKRGEAIFIPFFGELAATSRTLARVVRMSHAVVAPVFIVRQPDHRSHKIVIRDVLALQETDDADSDVEENTRRFLRAVEDMVREYPEQFLWTHRRYRTRPRGMAPVYDEPRRHRHSVESKSR